MFNNTYPSAIVVIFATIHIRLHQSSSHSASYVFLCWKSGYLIICLQPENQIKFICIHIFPTSYTSSVLS
jgi:hypothetical protein